VPKQVRRARAEGTPYKLVCRAQRSEDSVTAAVRPEKFRSAILSLPSPELPSAIHFETDILPGLAITEINPCVESTAYGILADFIRAVSAH